MITLSPSVLGADLMRIGEEIEKAERLGVRWLHLDNMDGHFAPNITFGPDFVRAIRKKTKLFLDVHLMLDTPLKFIDTFARAGADMITVHAEAKDDPMAMLRRIRELGLQSGLCINPHTPPDAVRQYLPQCDLVLVMTVEPGFGGQSFMHDQLPKISALRRMIDAVNPACELEVDGGVDGTTAKLVKEAGANVLVAGSAVFGKADRAAAIRAIRNA